MTPPTGEDWEIERVGLSSSVNKLPDSVTFIKDDGRMATGAAVYIVNWNLPNNLEMARHAVNIYGKPVGNWGGSILSFDTWPDMLAPRECVRYETRLAMPVSSPRWYDYVTGRTTLYTAINGRLCSNPDSPSHIVDMRYVLRYTRRRFFPTPTRDVLEPIQREGEPFVQSLEFNALPKTGSEPSTNAVGPG